MRGTVDVVMELLHKPYAMCWEEEEGEDRKEEGGEDSTGAHGCSWW